MLHATDFESEDFVDNLGSTPTSSMTLGKLPEQPVSQTPHSDNEDTNEYLSSLSVRIKNILNLLSDT